MSRFRQQTLFTFLALLAGLPVLLTPTPPTSGHHVPSALPQSAPTVVINEILAHTDAPNVDAVEFYNVSAAPVDLSGWWMTDDDTRPQSDWVRFPEGATILSHSLYVLADTEDEWPFGLSEAGDALYLFRPDPVSGAPVLADATLFGASPRNVSFIRYVDSVNIARFPLQEGAPTIGFPNCGIRISAVQLEELMIDPADGGSEYVVIANVGAIPAPLFDPERPVNPWKLIGQRSNGNDSDMYIFPPALVLAPGERIIVSEVAPNLFRQAHNIPDTVRIFGPLESGLSNTGERVALAAPLDPELGGAINFALVDEVTYSYLPPWPSVAENGLALVRIDPTRYANDVANWRAAPALQRITSGRVAGIGHDGATDTAQKDAPPAGVAGPHTEGDVFLPLVSVYRCPFD